jgi:alpha 1,2-mannosyltransferase
MVSTHKEYGRMMSMSSVVSHFMGAPAQNDVSHPPEDQDHPLIDSAPKSPPTVVSRRANASFVMLARNSDVNGAVRSIRALEDRFNRKHGYPYVFLNDVPFTENFKR